MKDSKLTNTPSFRTAFQRIYMETTLRTEEEMRKDALGARLCIMIIGALTIAILSVIDTSAVVSGLTGGTIVAAAIWGIPVVGGAVLGMVGLVMLAVLG